MCFLLVVTALAARLACCSLFSSFFELGVACQRYRSRALHMSNAMILLHFPARGMVTNPFFDGMATRPELRHLMKLRVTQQQVNFQTFYNNFSRFLRARVLARLPWVGGRFGQGPTTPSPL